MTNREKMDMYQIESQTGTISFEEELETIFTPTTMDNLTNASDQHDDSADYSALYTAKLTVHFISLVLGVCAIILNLGFLFAMCHTKDASLPYNRFMKGLSIADILCSLAFMLKQNFRMGPFIYMFPESDSFIVTEGLPYIYGGLPWVFFTAYFLTLTCLSVNQYIAVCKPWKYSNLASPKMVYTSMLVIWLISLLQLFIPTLVVIILNTFDNKEHASEMVFQISRIEMQAWMCVFILSTIVTITLNSLMYQKIRELKWKRRLSMNSQETLNIRMKQEAFVTICLLLVTAILLRLPFPIVSIIVLQSPRYNMDEVVLIFMQMLVIVLLYTNFFADPIIYIARMREAREFIRTTTSGCIHSCSSGNAAERTKAENQVALMHDCNEKTDVTTMPQDSNGKKLSNAVSSDNCCKVSEEVTTVV